MKIKKYLFVCILSILSSFPLYALQNISTNTAFSFFPGAADAMQSIYEGPFEKRFGSLTNDYFFIHLRSNPTIYMKGTNAFIDLKFGYYGAYDIPFSITGGFFFIPYIGANSLMEYTNIPGFGSTNFKYLNKKGFDTMGGNLEFLIKIYDIISTGLKVSFTYNDNSFITTNMTFKNSSGELINSTTSFNQNDSYYTLNAAIPLFIKHNDYFKHYFELGINYEQHFDSNGGSLKEGDFIKQDDRNFKSHSLIKPYVGYQFGYEFVPSVAELQIGVGGSFDMMFDIVNTSSKLYFERPDKNPDIKIYENQYTPGYNIDADIGILFQTSTNNQYVLFRMRPAIGYNFESDPYLKKSSYFGSSTGKSNVGEAISQIRSVSHSVYVYTPMALRIYNSSWPVGAIIASYMKFGYEYLGSEKKYLEASETNLGTEISYRHGWNYDIKTQFGLFVPINELYILEAAVNFNKTFEFESFDLRFTAPILYSKEKKPIFDNDMTNDNNIQDDTVTNDNGGGVGNDNLYNAIDENDERYDNIYENYTNPGSNLDDKDQFN